jgi:hypothetical protein
MPGKDLPKPVTEKLEKMWPKRTSTRAFEYPHKGETTYIVRFNTAEQEIEAWMDGKGKILAFAEDPLDDK